MKCSNCNKQAQRKFSGKWYCKKCFEKLVYTAQVKTKEDSEVETY